jgi:hypothetical protein
MQPNIISYIFDDFTFWESTWRKSWKTKTIQPTIMCMLEKVLFSFTLDYWVGLFNVELDPGFSGGSSL